MNNGRDCAHGRQVGKCDTCDLIDAEKEIAKLEAQLVEVNNNRTGVSPCAKFCEALAAKKMFDNLQRENSELKSKIAEKAAQVEWLRNVIIDATNNGAVTDSGKWIYSIDTSVLDKTPAQCLAEVRAQAVEEAVDIADELADDGKEWIAFIKRSAQDLRQQARKCDT